MAPADLFQPENETIAAYLERVELYYEANDIEAAKKVSILLTSIGDKTYTLLRNHFAPAKPSIKSYADVEAALKNHQRLSLLSDSTFTDAISVRMNARL